ncbi:MAG: 50S ribosomal protein L10 [Armatimonadota bacterium]
MIPISEKEIPHRDPRPDKVAQVETISELLDRSAGVVLTDYRGFTVAEKADLTRRLREAGAEYHVVKNTLFRLAYAERGENPEEMLSGPTAVAFALNDPVGPSKVLLDFIREKKKGTVKGGVVDGKIFNEDAIKRLSELPPKDQLIAQVVGAVQGPLAGLVYSLQGVLGNFVRTVQAIHDQKAEGGA